MVLITGDVLPGPQLERFVQEHDRHRNLQHCPPFFKVERTDGEDGLRTGLTLGRKFMIKQTIELKYDQENLRREFQHKATQSEDPWTGPWRPTATNFSMAASSKAIDFRTNWQAGKEKIQRNSF